MTRIGGQIGRISTLQASNAMLANLQRTQMSLLHTQEHLYKRVLRASDDPGAAASILHLQNLLQRRETQERNLSHAVGVLDNTDAALNDLHQILLEARDAAASQIGMGSDDATRATMAAILDDALRAAGEIANRSYQHVNLFGGSDAFSSGGVIRETSFGGMRYAGATSNLLLDVGLDRPVAINTNGIEAFGQLTVRVEGDVDLDPQASGATRLADLRGAQGEGIRLGSVQVSVNGSPLTVDLSAAATLGDVAAILDQAIADLGGTSTVTAAGNGLSVNIAAGDTIAVADVGAGRTAADLGLVLAATAGPLATAPTDLDPRLTKLTPLASLGPAIDWAGGLHITQGSVTKVADFSSATTIEDLQNVIAQLDLGLRLEINASRTGLNLVSDVSGVSLSIGENGGTTAGDLGLRSFDLNTRLSDFNRGAGVETVAGQPDFRIELHDGTSFDVDVTGLTTVGQVITAIEAAAAGAGVNVGVDFTVGLATVGNGLVIADNTVGGGDFRIYAQADSGQVVSRAAEDLGITFNAGAGATIAGEDRATVRVESLFTHLREIRDALLSPGGIGIEVALEKLEADIDRLVQARGGVGIRARQIDDATTRATALKLAEQTTLSELQDQDFTEMATRYSNLMTQLQANLQLTAAGFQLSLLDFLR
jgi:flagellar hook-associated protein 3 FlgL